jgi:hypothetical protein
VYIVVTLARHGARPGLNERAPLGGFRRDQLGRAIEQRLDLLGVAPQERDRLPVVADLAVLVILVLEIDGPERSHVALIDIGMELIQGRLAVRPAARCFAAHGLSFCRHQVPA